MSPPKRREITRCKNCGFLNLILGNCCRCGKRMKLPNDKVIANNGIVNTTVTAQHVQINKPLPQQMSQPESSWIKCKTCDIFNFMSGNCSRCGNGKRIKLSKDEEKANHNVANLTVTVQHLQTNKPLPQQMSPPKTSWIWIKCKNCDIFNFMSENENCSRCGKRIKLPKDEEKANSSEANITVQHVQTNKPTPPQQISQPKTSWIKCKNCGFLYFMSGNCSRCEKRIKLSKNEEKAKNSVANMTVTVQHVQTNKPLPQQVAPPKISWIWITCTSCGFFGFMSRYCSRCGKRINLSKDKKKAKNSVANTAVTAQP